MSICDGMNHDSNNAVFTEERPNRDVAVAPSCKTLKLELCEYELEANVDQSKPDFRLIDTKKLSNVKLESSDLENQYETSETESETQLSSEFLSKGNLLPSKIKTEINVEELTSSCYDLNDDIKFENFSVTVKSEEIDTDDLNIRNEAELNCNSGPSQKCHSVPKKVDKPVNKAVDAGEGEASYSRENIIGDQSTSLFRCNLCSFRNKSEKLFKKHALIHNRPSIFQCPYCFHKTMYRYHLHTHIITIHKRNEQCTFKCNSCDYITIRKRNLKQHELTHKGENEVPIFNCTYCSFKTKYQRSLALHTLSFHGKGKDALKCDICGYETLVPSRLKAHQLIHKSEDEVKMFECNECAFKSKHKNGIRLHIKTVHIKELQPIFKCNLCDYKSIHKTMLKNHEWVHQSKKERLLIQCSHCSFTPKDKCSLVEHEQAVHGVKKKTIYTCNICQYKTVVKGRFKSHVLVHKPEDEIEMFRCDLCTFKTKYKRGINRHIARVHKKEEL